MSNNYEINVLTSRLGVLKLGDMPPLGVQKICKGGTNDLVVVFVMRTYKEIKIRR